MCHAKSYGEGDWDGVRLTHALLLLLHDFGNHPGALRFHIHFSPIERTFLFRLLVKLKRSNSVNSHYARTRILLPRHVTDNEYRILMFIMSFSATLAAADSGSRDNLRSKLSRRITIDICISMRLAQLD